MKSFKKTLDISVIKTDEHQYACKTFIVLNEDSANVTIVKISEVTNVSADGNTFTKIKDLFDAREEKLNRIVFKDVIVSLMNRLKQKYHVSRFSLKIE